MAKKHLPHRTTFIYKGKRIDVEARTQGELINKAARKRLEIENPGNIFFDLSKDEITVSDWIEEYLEIRSNDNTSLEQQGNIKHMLNHLGDEKGHILLAELNRTDIYDVLSTMAKKGLAKSYIQKTRGQISAAVKEAVGKYIDVNVAADVKNATNPCQAC